MSETTVVLEIDAPHFTVKLYESLLQLDLKGTVKNEIEEALENKPILKETIGGILGIFVPLHINLRDIDSVNMDPTGKVKITLPHRRDIIIPLKPNEAKRLVDKLNQLIPQEKEKELERAVKEQQLKKDVTMEQETSRASVTYGAFSAPQPPGVIKSEKDAEKERKQD
jgi:hypothetical protein